MHEQGRRPRMPNMLGVLQHSGKCALCTMVRTHHVQKLHSGPSVGCHQSSHGADPTTVLCILPLVQPPVAPHNLQRESHISTEELLPALDG